MVKLHIRRAPRKTLQSFKMVLPSVKLLGGGSKKKQQNKNQREWLTEQQLAGERID